MLQNNLLLLNLYVIFYDYVKVELLTSLFVGVDNLKEKLRIWIHKYISSQSLHQIEVMHWLECSRYKDELIVFIGPIGYGLKDIWEYSSLRVVFLLSYTIYTLSLISKFFKKLKNLVFLRIYGSIFNVIYTNERKFKNNNVDFGLQKKPQDYKVLFFPHNSIFTGMGYVKDHFYSADPNR